MYTRDGGVISAGIPVSDRKGTQGHRRLFGLYKGQVVKTTYPNNKESITGERIEYTIRVKGQNYPNAFDMRKGGALFNYSERIYKERKTAFSGKVDDSTFDENFDGELVYVLFLEGNGDIPIIIGAAEHPRHPSYKRHTSSDDLFDLDEYNGVEVKVDKDSNYTITQTGRKDERSRDISNPTILNPEAVDAFFKLFGNGDIELNTHGTPGTADNRMRFTKADKKIEIYAQENKIIIDSAGIKIEDKNNNKATLDSAGILVEDKNSNTVEMKSGEVNVTVTGTANINTTGDAKITTGGNVELNGATGDVTTTFTDPVIDLITGFPTTGVFKVKAG